MPIHSTAQQYGGDCSLLYKEVPQWLHTQDLAVPLD